MKCLVCGRTMTKRGMLAQCPNVLCDYEEDIDDMVQLSYELPKQLLRCQNSKTASHKAPESTL